MRDLAGSEHEETASDEGAGPDGGGTGSTTGDGGDDDVLALSVTPSLSDTVGNRGVMHIASALSTVMGDTW